MISSDSTPSVTYAWRQSCTSTRWRARNGITPWPNAPPAETTPIASPGLRGIHSAARLFNGAMMAPRPSTPSSAWYR